MAKQINEVIKASQIDKEKTRQEHSEKCNQWSERTQFLVLGLFTRLADLFGELSKSKGLVIYKYAVDSQGKEYMVEPPEFTREFKLWCQKLEGLTEEEFRQGMSNLEERIEKASRDNIKSFPPSYAEFRGLCFCGKQTSKYRSWKGLPKPVMSNEERKKKMKEMRSKLKL